jgi:phosphate transport system substrate-binding protein
MRPIYFIAALVLGFGYYALPKGDATRFRITGSSTVHPIVQEACRILEGRDASVIFEVETGGSGRGISDARGGLADIGMASRDLKPEEQEGISTYAIALDGVTLVAHADRKLQGLTSDQVRSIYTGKITNWQELGGPDQEIQVLNKAEGRATLEVFLKGFGLKNSEIRADAVVGDNAQCVRMVKADPFAIGYLSIGEALSAVERGDPLQLLDLDGIPATLDTVKDGSFPLGRTLYLLFPAGEVNETGRRVLDILGGPEGHSIMADLGFVPLIGS